METVESLLATAKRPGASRAGRPVIIDAFLSAVRALGDSTPSDKDLDISRRYVALLTEQTSVDHLKSVDEMLAQVPTEFQAAVKGLTEAESFIFMAASAQLEKTTRALDRDWDLVHAIDRDGHTALHAAAAQGNTEVCEVLLSRGANASVQDYEGYTPVHWAVESNSVEVVNLLLSHGADATVKNNSGFTAHDMVHALKPKHQAAMFALLDMSRRAPPAPVSSPSSKVKTAPTPKVQ